jgi:hypothetical protein
MSAEEVGKALALLRRVRALLQLSGFANAAQAGFLQRFGLRNLADLQQLRADIDQLLAEVDDLWGEE